MHSHKIRMAAGIGLGGIGFTGRLLLALAIIFALKYFDKSKTRQEEYNRAVKTLLAGRAVVIVAGLIIGGIFTALFMIPLPWMMNW